MGPIELGRIVQVCVAGDEITCLFATGPVRWSPARGWENLGAMAGPGPWTLTDMSTGGAVPWVLAAGRALRLRPGAPIALLQLGDTPAEGLAVADDGERWAVSSGMRVLLGRDAARTAVLQGEELPALPAPCETLTFFGPWLVAGGRHGLWALRPGAAAGWTELAADAPVRTLVPAGDRLHYVSRLGARALDSELNPVTDARDWFRLAEGRLWCGAGRTVGVSKRMFELAGTPSFRNWAPLPEAHTTVRGFETSLVEAVVPARAGVFVATRVLGLLLLPDGERSWEVVALPGRPDDIEPVMVAAGDGQVVVASGPWLWSGPDEKGQRPVMEPVARPFLVFPTGPVPELAETVLPDGSGAHATGACIWNDALWYAAAAVPAEQPGVLHRVTEAGDAPVWENPVGPEAFDLVCDTSGEPWVIQERQVVKLASLVVPKEEANAEDTQPRADASSAAEPVPGEDDGDTLADGLTVGEAESPPDDEPTRLDEAAAPPKPRGIPDTIAVGETANLNDFRAAYAAESELPEILDGRSPRPITAVAFTPEAAIIATAGGYDYGKPISRMTSFAFLSRIVYVGLDGRDTSVVSIADEETDLHAHGVFALAVRGREVWAATAFGIASWWRSGATGEPPEFRGTALGAPGVERPPYTQARFVHAYRDRVLLDSFAWYEASTRAWFRWSGEALERYAGDERVDLNQAPGSASATAPGEAPPPSEPRPYIADHDRGWQPEGPAPDGLPPEPVMVTAAAETVDSLWIGTTAGLVRYDTKAGTYETLGPARGLSTPWVSSLRSVGSHLLVSTIDGIFLLPGARS